MKAWLLMIFCVNKNLDAECDKIEEKIQKLSLSSTLPAVTLYDKIIGLTTRKNDLINLRVLYNAMVDALTEAELKAVCEAASNKRLRSAASRDDGKQFRLRTDFGRRGEGAEIDRILSVCMSVAVKAGYSTKRFERTYPYLLPQKKTA